MSFQPPPLPYGSKMIETGKDRYGLIATITQVWGNAFRELQKRLFATAKVVAQVLLDHQQASIVTANLLLTNLAGGAYRVQYHTKIQVVDGVASSVTVTIGWTQDGNACAFSGAVLNGNTANTQQQRTFPIVIDANTDITYAVAYVSNTPGQMKYMFFVSAEAMDA